MYVHFVEYERSAGRIVLCGTLGAEDYSTAELAEGRARLVLPYAAFLGDMRIHLPTLRAVHWQAVRAARDRAEGWGCTTPLGRADTDADSQRRVSGAVQLATIALAAGEPFSVPWTMQDNSVVDHDAAAMIALGVAVGQHIMACHAAARAKRAVIEAGEVEANILSADHLSGWPDAPPVQAA